MVHKYIVDVTVCACFHNLLLLFFNSCGYLLNKSITLSKNSCLSLLYGSPASKLFSWYPPNEKLSCRRLLYWLTRHQQAIFEALSLTSNLGYVHRAPNEFPTGWKFVRLGVLFKRYHANRYKMKFKRQAVQKFEAKILSQYVVWTPLRLVFTRA